MRRPRDTSLGHQRDVDHQRLRTRGIKSFIACFRWLLNRTSAVVTRGLTRTGPDPYGVSFRRALPGASSNEGAGTEWAATSRRGSTCRGSIRRRGNQDLGRSITARARSVGVARVRWSATMSPCPMFGRDDSIVRPGQHHDRPRRSQSTPPRRWHRRTAAARCPVATLPRSPVDRSITTLGRRDARGPPARWAGASRLVSCIP